MDSFHLRIVTPEKDYLSMDGEVLVLDVESKGQISLYSHHVDMIASIDVTPLEIRSNGHIRHYAISDGILSISQKDNSIKIVVDSIQSKEEIDAEKAEKEKEEARALLNDAAFDDNARKKAAYRLKKALNLLYVKNEVQDI